MKEMKDFFVEAHRVFDFTVTVSAESEEEARSKVEDDDFSDEEMDTYEEPWPQEGNVKVDHIQEVKQVKQTKLSG
jgi:hypothetical protein